MRATSAFFKKLPKVNSPNLVALQQIKKGGITPRFHLLKPATLIFWTHVYKIRGV
jgi:hypothetical protein